MATTLSRSLGLLFFLGACGQSSDPRTEDGALAYAASAIADGDLEKLFRVIDSRSRNAMISIVADRRRARTAIERSYPEGERARAIAELGDAAEVTSAEALFARRCDRACVAQIRDSLGAIVESRRDGVEQVVRTTRGRELRLYRKRPTDWWGIVYRTAELSDERDRANRDRGMIEENARTYDRRRALGE